MSSTRKISSSDEYYSLHYSSYVIDSGSGFDHHNGHVKWKGPRRVCLFCTLAIVLPSLLISIPLLMRFVIYGSSTYLIHPSDTRVLDHRISTTWCEAETVRMNTSFTAYVTNGEPNVFEAPTKLSIDQVMKIPDDQKEYWGLYLLPGSKFRIRACARHRGATLLIVRGNAHMKYCAYVGENDSAGDSDEVSSSSSAEAAWNKKSGGPHPKPNPGNESQEVDLSILSKLKNYLQSHPNSRNKVQKTLEDWMLLTSNSSGLPETVNGTASEEIETTTESLHLPTESLERGTLHRRRRREAEVRKHTESGENGAFEDETNDVLPTNSSKSYQTPTTVWQEQHGHHVGVFNQSLDTEDGSMSESESSFSSSEEALLKCEGIVASFNIPQEDDCRSEGTFEELTLTKLLPKVNSTAFEFVVTEREYYYFIFGSENEKYTNLVRSKLELQKKEYQLPEPVENCTDVQECQISLRFVSSQKVVITLPQPIPNATSNVVYLAETECKPRAHLYLIFVILVPLAILLFAFQ